MPSSIPMRRLFVAVTLCCALLVGTTACGGGSGGTKAQGGTQKVAAAVAEPTPTPSTSAQRQKFAKTRFVANAGLAAGAAYQWIIKPARAGKFKKGADGRRFALIKAGLAGAFTYNRLKAASKNAKGDPTLAKAVAPLTAGIESLKDLPSKLRKGKNSDSTAGIFDDMINKVKDAGKGAGAEVVNKVPSTKELTGG